MIKKSLQLSALVLTTGLFAVTSLQAGTVHFADGDYYFPGYAYRTTEDQIGNPKINGMDVTWNDSTGYLQTVVISLKAPGIIRFDTLFINSDYNDGDTNWQNWDYIVHSGGSTIDVLPSPTNIKDINGVTSADRPGMIPGNGVFAVSEAYNYTFVNNANGRNNHPNGIDAINLTKVNPELGYTDLQGSYDNNLTITYNFSGYNIHTGGTFAIAYAPWCANDIIIGKNNGDPVPEPATMLLFGSGLVGLAGLRRIRRK